MGTHGWQCLQFHITGIRAVERVYPNALKNLGCEKWKQLSFSPQQKEGRLKKYTSRTAVTAYFLTQDMSLLSVRRFGIWDDHACPNQIRSTFTFTVVGVLQLSYTGLAIRHPYLYCFEMTLMYMTLCRTAHLKNKMRQKMNPIYYIRHDSKSLQV